MISPGINDKALLRFMYWQFLSTSPVQVSPSLPPCMFMAPRRTMRSSTGIPSKTPPNSEPTGWQLNTLLDFTCPRGMKPSYQLFMNCSWSGPSPGTSLPHVTLPAQCTTQIHSNLSTMLRWWTATANWKQRIYSQPVQNRPVHRKWQAEQILNSC